MSVKQTLKPRESQQRSKIRRHINEARSKHALQFRRTVADHPDFFTTVTNYCLLGATDKQLAKFFGAEPEVWHLWYQDSPELRNAINEGRDEADIQVVQAMQKRATGYDYVAPKVIVTQGKGTIIDVVQHVPPDVTAGKFWLTNRRPKQWKDKVTNVHSGEDGGPIEAELTIKFIAPDGAPQATTVLEDPLRLSAPIDVPPND